MPGETAADESRDAEIKRIAEVGVRRIDATSGRLEMDITVSKEMAVIFAEWATHALDSSGAENYVEMQLRHPDKPEMVTILIQRWLKKTPHQLRQQAEAEVARLTTENERLRGIAAALREVLKGKERLMACYRTGSHRNADAALTAIEKAEAKLSALSEGGA